MREAARRACRKGSGLLSEQTLEREDPAVEVDDEYAAGADRPLAQYTVFMAAYGAAGCPCPA